MTKREIYDMRKSNWGKKGLAGKFFSGIAKRDKRQKKTFGDFFAGIHKHTSKRYKNPL